MRKSYICFLFLFVCTRIQAQVVISAAGTAYSQLFNSLAQTGSSNTWTDNVTLVGWFSTQTAYIADNGSSTAGGLHSYGPAAAAAGDVSDRALGALTSGSVSPVRIGLQLKNGTGSDLTSFTVSYAGEEWRRNAAAQTLAFEYSTDATSLSTGTWSAVSSLDFTGPQIGSATAIDGNASANRVTLSSTIVATIVNNGTIWFRWTKTGTNSAGLGIDDFAVTPNSGVVNSITTGSVATSPFCVDASTSASGNVAYSATGTFNTTFTAYLSDATGTFNTPVAVGDATVTGTNPTGTINITIPAGTASGTGYRIRVGSTSPALTGTSSAAVEIVNGPRNVTAANASAGNTQATVTWTNPTTCFDDVLIVAKASASISGMPTGDGSAYNASTTYGSGTTFDGGFVVYKGLSSPQTITALTNGTLYYFKIFSRKGSNWSSGVEVSATPSSVTGPGDVVINQFSPDYNNAADEYVELLNKTSRPVNLSGFALRYQSASGGTTTTLGNLTGVIPANSYWLLSPNATVTVGTTNGLARDGSFADGMNGTSGQIALVRANDNTVIDGVGYGTVNGGIYREGTAAPSPPSNGGLKRSPDGADNNDNSTDFVTVANANIFLRNSGQQGALPVRFANLQAIKKASGVNISWSNLTESNIKIYNVERSLNGRDFVSVTAVTPLANQQNRADYSVTDGATTSGWIYYRIRSTEADGRTTLSNVLKLANTGISPAISIYPNPVKSSEIFLQLSNIEGGSYTIQLVSSDGRTIRSETRKLAAGSVTETFGIRNLPSGLYVLQISGSQQFSQRFLKE